MLLLIVQLTRVGLKIYPSIIIHYLFKYINILSTKERGLKQKIIGIEYKNPLNIISIPTLYDLSFR